MPRPPTPNMPRPPTPADAQASASPEDTQSRKPSMASTASVDTQSTAASSHASVEKEKTPPRIHDFGAPLRRSMSGHPMLGVPPCVDDDAAYVWLNVYDLGTMSKWLLNKWLPRTVGAFHCGVEVLGAEYCFQGVVNLKNQELTGIACHPARQHTQHQYSCSIPLGHMPRSPKEFHTIMEKLSTDWLARSYHFVQRNCIDFAEALLRELEVPEPFPEWVRGAAKNVLMYTPLATLTPGSDCYNPCASMCSSAKCVGEIRTEDQISGGFRFSTNGLSTLDVDPKCANVEARTKDRNIETLEEIAAHYTFL